MKESIDVGPAWFKVVVPAQLFAALCKGKASKRSWRCATVAPDLSRDALEDLTVGAGQDKQYFI